MSDFHTPNKATGSNLVEVDNPDDFTFEGEQAGQSSNVSEESQGDQDTLVIVDSPDDFSYEGGDDDLS
ncbi:MAG: hypothetical protein JWN30_1786 [Bacilli bacterium]|nr:hypothetical protein [Bacilli bacterium]